MGEENLLITEGPVAETNEICRMSAVGLAAAVQSKKLSATEILQAFLSRMEKLEPHLHAFCTRTPDLARKASK